MSVGNTGQHRHSVVKSSVHYIGFCLLLQSCSHYLPTLGNSVVKNLFCFLYPFLSMVLSNLNYPSLWPVPDTHSYYLHTTPSLQPCILVCLWMYYPLDFLSVIQYVGEQRRDNHVAWSPHLGRPFDFREFNGIWIQPISETLNLRCQQTSTPKGPERLLSKNLPFEFGGTINVKVMFTKMFF